MSEVQQLITKHLDIWTAADTGKKSGRGRSSLSFGKVYGISKLRELILELAMRGKLVTQDSNDGHADAILAQLLIKKTALSSSGKIKKDKNRPQVAVDDRPFELPCGWVAERLGNIAQLITKGTTPTSLGFSYQSSGVSFVKVENVVDGRINKNSIDQYISDEADEALARSRLAEGDVLFSIAGTIGRTCIVHEIDLPANTNQAFAIIRGTKSAFDQTFLLRQLDSFVSNKIKERARGGAMYNVSLSDIADLILIIPPLAEQHRIVAKVDELMALCDQLEAQHSNAADAHEQLVSHLLGTLTQSQDAADFNTNWQRIATHFDTLFTTESSIDFLKKTLLQLAVMGKLVPQDPSDEPASELLKRIQAEKAKLIAEGKIKKNKPLSAIGEDEKPFDLPRNWTWVRLQNAIDVRDGTHDSPKEAQGSDTYPLVTSKDFNQGEINFESARRISSEDHFEIAKRSLVEKYDVLFSMIGGNIGNQAMVLDERLFSIKNVALFKYYDTSLTNPFFIKKYLENLAQTLQSTAIGGAQPFVALGALRNLILALPPISEQHRIVAKVDKLMTLCEQLKSRITDARQHQQKLADVLVEQALVT